MTSGISRQVFGAPVPVATGPAPAPTIERIPRTVDGCTWYAYAFTASGDKVGATARTKRDALLGFADQWTRFA